MSRNWRSWISDRQVIMNENAESARDFWDSLYERHGRILASTIRRRPRSLRHLRISNYGERSVSLEGGNFAVASVLARNGIVGPVIPLRPAGVMTGYTRFRRACESRRSAWIHRVCWESQRPPNFSHRMYKVHLVGFKCWCNVSWIVPQTYILCLSTGTIWYRLEIWRRALSARRILRI